MKIKMKTLLAGPDGVWQIGSIQQVDGKMGRDLVSGGYAELISEDLPIEIADKTPPINTATRPQRMAAASKVIRHKADAIEASGEKDGEQ